MSKRSRQHFIYYDCFLSTEGEEAGQQCKETFQWIIQSLVTYFINGKISTFKRL